MKTKLLAGLAGAALLAAPAEAGHRHGSSDAAAWAFGGLLVGLVAGAAAASAALPPVVYQAPPPAPVVIYQPAPPPPVIVAPAPRVVVVGYPRVVCAPLPVVIAPPVYCGPPHGYPYAPRGWHGGRRAPHGAYGPQFRAGVAVGW